VGIVQKERNYEQEEIIDINEREDALENGRDVA
jgi:hypothetical protein